MKELPKEILDKIEAEIEARFGPSKKNKPAFVHRCALIRGAEFALQQSAWVDVKERLPDDDKPVLAWDGGEVFIAYWQNNEWNADECSTEPLVSFWQPLPKPPQP